MLIIFEFLNWVGYINLSLDYSWLGLIGLALVLLIILEVVGFPWYVWSAVLAGVIIDAASDIFHLYGAFTWWDRMVHFSGGALAGVVVLHMLFRLRAKGFLHFDNKLLIPMLVTTVSFLGFLYEGWELVIDTWYFGGRHALGPAGDTVDDQFLNITGALIVGILFYFITKKWKRLP